MNPQLTKDDTRALWYAVDAYTSMVKAMRDLPTPIPDDVAAKERKVLATAKRALRKVNAIRKAGATRQSMRPNVLALIDREIEDARAYGLRFARDTCFRESAEKKLAVLEELRPKVQALQEQQQTAGAI